MARGIDRTELLELLAETVNNENPMLHLMEFLLGHLMEAEVEVIVGADRSERTDKRKNYRSGYRNRRFDTRLGSMELKIPKLRTGGYVPCFLDRGKRCEEALIAVVAEAYVSGISTRKLDEFVQSLGIAGISKSQVSQMAKSLDKEAEAFRTRSLRETSYPILIVDALFEKVRVDGVIQSTAVMVVCGINAEGRREVVGIELMPEESKDAYLSMFSSLKERGLDKPALIISDAHKGLVSAIAEGFPGTLWQRCKVHLMRNIMAYVSQKGKNEVSGRLKEIWLAPTREAALARAKEFCQSFEKRYPKAVETLENGLEDSLTFYAFPKIDPRKISSSNMLERLNREFRRRSKVVTVFPSIEAYLRLLTTYVIEYTDDWQNTGRAYIEASALQNYAR